MRASGFAARTVAARDDDVDVAELVGEQQVLPVGAEDNVAHFLGLPAAQGSERGASGWALGKERGGGRKGARMDQTHAQVSQAHSFSSLSSPPVAIHVPQREKSIARMHSECGPAAVESVRLAAPTLTKGDFALAYN